MPRQLFDVFLSSTLRDMKEERHQLTHALLRTDFRPVHMETFPATRKRADQLIRDMVLVCDYFVLLLGRQYGSIVRGSEVSFTELEYDQARAAGIPVLAFLLEVDDENSLEPQIARFRAKVREDVVCQFWSETHELIQLVTQALVNESRDSPSPGWVRADPLGIDPVGYLGSVAVPARELGISRISLDGVAGPIMGDRLAHARQIRIMSTSGVRLIETQKTALARAVRAGAELKVLTPAADSEFVQDVCEVEARDQSSDHIAREIRLLRTRLREVVQEANSQPDLVQLGRMSTQLRVTLTLTEGWGWMSLTLPPLRTPETASLELINEGDQPLLVILKKHFDTVWQIVAARGNVEAVNV